MTELPSDTSSIVRGIPNFDCIPLELKKRNQWILWKLEISHDKLTKIPYYESICGLGKASSTNSKTWTSFEKIKSQFSEYDRVSGVGFVFHAGDPFIGIDFDKCIDPETGLIYPSIEPDIIELNSYTEISQGKKGIHVIGKGCNPDPEEKGSHNGNFEMYSRGRYFTITGNVYKDFPKEVNEIPQDVLNRFYKKYFVTGPSESKPKTIEQLQRRNHLYLADEEILSICEKANNAVKFNSLWHGDIQAYVSQSEAEIALCCILAFYTRDEFQLQRLLRNSGLYRKKMDRVDYIGKTIKKSLELVSEKYDPKAQVRRRWIKRQLVMRGDSIE